MLSSILSPAPKTKIGLLIFRISFLKSIADGRFSRFLKRFLEYRRPSFVRVTLFFQNEAMVFSAREVKVRYFYVLN